MICANYLDIVAVSIPVATQQTVALGSRIADVHA